MKLLLQRSLSQGPSWVESAHWDGERLYGFRERARGYQSISEPRFAPDGTLHWIRDGRLYREGHDQPLTHRPTYKVAFSADGSWLTLESERFDIPFGWCRQGGDIHRFKSSINHLCPIRGGEQWMFSSFDRLYSGPLTDLQDRGSLSSSRFCAGPEAYYYAVKRKLFKHKYRGGEAECVFTGGGPLDFPLHTSAGIFVSQTSPARIYLVDEQTGAQKLLWSGSGERLVVCDAT